MILMHRPLLGGPRSERRRAENLDRARGSSCRADPPEVWQRRLTGAGWLARMPVEDLPAARSLETEHPRRRRRYHERMGNAARDDRDTARREALLITGNV